MTMPNTHNEHETSPSSDLMPISKPSEPAAERITHQVPAPRQPDQVQTGLADTVRRQHEVRNVHRLTVRAEYLMKARVRHPDGGESPVDEILATERAQRESIEAETAAGSFKHRRAPRWMQWIPRFVLLFDFSLLLYFFAGITNVNWASPVSMELGFAIILAAMVTVLSYGYLAFTGHRLRGHKNHAGTIHSEELDAFTKIILGVATVVILVIAALMFLRMHAEVLGALGPQGSVVALVIAAALAVVSGAANFLVIAIHALNGSDQVARLENLSAAAHRSYAKAQRMREEAARRTDYGL
jgi:hypothetical protein